LIACREGFNLPGPDDASRKHRVGQQLGNYQLVRLLGEGGFAEVYLGEHIHLGTPAAIKVSHTQLISEEIEKFRNEARMIARLIHPHIVRVLDFGVEEKTPFLVLDYAPNGTLRQRHARGGNLASKNYRVLYSPNCRCLAICP
jgi:eukaryotic-like serine/threonine-protein kinase